MMIVWYLGCRITPWIVGRFLAALLAAAAFVGFVVVFLMFVFSKKKATLEAFQRFPPVLRRAGVSKMAFKSLVVFRSGVRGLGVESAGRR